MKSIIFLFCLFPIAVSSFAQVKIESGDPQNPANIPLFFKSKLEDIETEIKTIKKGEVKIIAESPGALPVYAVFYGEKEDLKSQANYNSAVGAKNPAFYAQKDSATKPIVLFIGPVHGHEVENIAGLVNLIHIAETGKDYRGKNWLELQKKLEKTRTIIIPCGNPDGRIRCPYNSFLGLPTQIMTKYGQGTRKDGSLYGWPLAKSIHPMKGDLGILGAYFNNDGINIMQDEFFNPMAKETKAILEIARTEAPDMAVSLHSHENRPIILQPAHVGMFQKKQVYNLAINVNERYKKEGLVSAIEDWFWKPEVDDKNGPENTFNLTSAIHHISGAMSFTFECTHGSVSETKQKPLVNFDELLDIQLLLYDEMYQYIFENKKQNK